MSISFIWKISWKCSASELFPWLHLKLESYQRKQILLDARTETKIDDVLQSTCYYCRRCKRYALTICWFFIKTFMLLVFFFNISQRESSAQYPQIVSSKKFFWSLTALQLVVGISVVCKARENENFSNDISIKLKTTRGTYSDMKTGTYWREWKRYNFLCADVPLLLMTALWWIAFHLNGSCLIYDDDDDDDESWTMKKIA